MPQYVQHISGQGEKFHLINEKTTYFVVSGDVECCWMLPKSEYRLCEPPERWVDVTEACDMTENNWPSSDGLGPALVDHTDSHDKHNCILVPTHWTKGYRLRKVQLYEKGAEGTFCPKPQWAFIVEKKEVG